MVVSPDSGVSRVVLDSATSHGVPPEKAIWSGHSRMNYFKSHDARGNAEFWSIPPTGGQPMLLTRFDGSVRPSYRPERSMGGGHGDADERQLKVLPRNPA
jgi:hypothetical protein